MATPSAKTSGHVALPTAHVDEIDRAVQRGVYDKTYSAAACIGSIGTRMFHRAVYGSAVQPPPLRKVGLDTLFDLASLSKPLGAGLAALYLVGRSRMDLSITLDRVLPEFRQSPHMASIRVDMLLDHTAGFDASLPRLWEQDGWSVNTPAEKTVARYKETIAKLPLAYVPGSKMIYSDVGFMVLGWVVEQVTGKPLDIFLEQEIYKPLQLDSDVFFVRHGEQMSRKRIRNRVVAATEQCAWRGKLIQGEVHDPHAWCMGGVAGHAGLFGTVDGVWRLLHQLLKAYRAEDSFFHSGTVQRFWTRSKRPADTTRTLAWDTPSAQNSQAGQRFSRTAVGHLGFTGCSMWIDPSKSVIGVYLANAAHPSPDNKSAAMAVLRPRVFDLIAKYAALP